MARSDRSGHLGDGIVGNGDEDDVDVLGGLRRVVTTADGASAAPAGSLQGDPERRAGPARADDAEVHGL
ncbi:MAG: hypothetical protein AAFO29_02130 [Actinomycetota bacterium]